MSSGPSKVIVLDPDPRAGRQVQLGFEREGVPTCVPAIPQEPGTVELDGLEPGVVLVGGRDGRALDLVRQAKAWLTMKQADVPIVFTGRGPSRRELEAAGADEVLSRPAYLRDLVTIARLLRGVPASQRDHLVGSLVETSNVLALVRAFATLGRSAVLTLIRGLRRGEIRFFHGEVTSAQVGLIHGQAALHQLLLWTDARFDYSHEDIVRRQQIPLSPEELFADAERFLEGVREHAGQLSPATVLEQDVQRVHALGKQIPTEVHGVLRMFDGHRVLADVLEDSPYRVFETLRVAQKALETGLLRVVQAQRPKATWRAVLAIEEWLVGNETRDAVVERTATLDSGPVSTRKVVERRKRRNRKTKVTPRTEAKADIDWGALVPRVIGGEVGPLSGVVPAQETHGELELPTRDKPREGLEALMDTDKRQKIFPTDVGLEPKVVLEPEAAAWARTELATDEPPSAPKPRGEDLGDIENRPPRSRRWRDDAAITTLQTADTPPAGTPVVQPPLGAGPPIDDAEAREWAEAEAKARSAAEAEPTDAVADAKEWAEAAARARAEADAEERADAEAQACAGAKPRLALGRGTAVDTGHAKSRIANLPPRPPGADDIDPATEALVAVPQYLEPMKSDPVAAVTAVPPSASEPRPPRPAGVTDAEQLVRELVAQAVPRSDAGEPAEPPPSAAPPSPIPAAASPAPAPATDEDAITTTFIKSVSHDDAAAHAAPSALVAEPIAVAEARATTVAVPDVATIGGPAETAGGSASPRVLLGEQASTAPLASSEPARSLAPRSSTERSEPAAPAGTPQPTRGDDAAPEATADEPSDGVVRATLATADTARARAVRRRPTAPEHDGPPLKETTGEIRDRPLTDKEPAVAEPSILVADLAAAHDAIAAVANLAAATPPPGDAASPSRELAVAEVRRDAVAFSEEEEAFFRGADRSTQVARVQAPETFADLDEGYQPPKFWDRVFGRKPKKPR